MQVHFRPEVQEEPVELYHHLTLYDAGGANNAKRPVGNNNARACLAVLLAVHPVSWLMPDLHSSLEELSYSCKHRHTCVQLNS